MSKKFRFPKWLLVFYCLFPLMAIPAFANDDANISNNMALENWVEKERFLDSPISERFALLEKLSRQEDGERIFRASMDSFSRRYSFGLKIIDARMDLKTLLDSFHIADLRFFTSDKIKIRSDMVFKKCSLKSMIEELCQQYNLQSFYHASRIYFIPTPTSMVNHGSSYKKE